jgi:hypothetical protein
MSESESTRRVDILAIDKNKKVGWIIDPKIRFEEGLNRKITWTKKKDHI